MVASELSISAGGSMVAMTVDGPSMPRTVELVDPRSRQWERIDREPSRGPVVSGHSTGPTLETNHRPRRTAPSARGCTDRPPVCPPPGRWCTCTAVRKSRRGRVTARSFRELLNAGITVLTPNVRGSGGFGQRFHARRRQGETVRRHRRRRRQRCVSLQTTAWRTPAASHARGGHTAGFSRWRR